MVGTIVHQLTDGCSAEELEKAGLGAYYTDHGVGVYPQAAAGFPFTASVLAVKGDPIADLQEDLAAEQKARATSIMAILPMVIVSSIFYMKSDYINWSVALYCAAGGIIGGIICAKLLKKLPDKILKIIFILFLIYSSVKMIFF